MNTVQRRKRRQTHRFSVLYFLLPLLMIGAMVAGWVLWAPRPLPLREIVLTLAPDQTIDQLAARLFQEKLVSSEQTFRQEARIQHLDTFFKGGEYLLSSRSSPAQIVNQLKEHQVLRYKFSLPEGFTLRQMAERFSAAPLESTTKTSSPTPFAGKDLFLQLTLEGRETFAQASQSEQAPIWSAWLLDNPIPSLEGYLFPGTYTLERIDEKTLVMTLLDAMAEGIPQAWLEQAQTLGWTFHQVFTLASMIEKEAQVDSERAVISSVFHNRLQEEMLLQCDPTVEYAIGSHHFPLTAEEMAVDSPYNTYLYPGLPIGPICNPGLASIEAALFPAQTDYYYFVAKEDGSHLFARTYEEHLANIDEIWGSP
jgi:UPF0755 protein